MLFSLRHRAVTPPLLFLHPPYWFTSLFMNYSSNSLVDLSCSSNASPGSRPTYHPAQCSTRRFTTSYCNPFTCIPFLSIAMLRMHASTSSLSIVIGSYNMSPTFSDCLSLRSWPSLNGRRSVTQATFKIRVVSTIRQVH